MSWLRSHRIWYGIALLLVLCVVVSAFIWPGWARHSNPQIKNQSSADSLTAAESEDRLAMMNVLNSFSIPPSPGTATSTDELSRELEALMQRLNALQVEPSLASVQQELVSLANQWRTRLAEGQATGDLEVQFVDLGRRYPWLNTLLWIIILNRL